MKHIKLYEEFLNESINEANEVITIADIDIDFTLDDTADPKKEIASAEKKFKIKVKPTGKSYNVATKAYNLTGKKKDLLSFLTDEIGLEDDYIEEAYPELYEATTSWSNMMRGVRAGGSGPWSIVAIQDRKVVGQSIDIKIQDLIPAKYEALKKEFPKAKLHIEDGGGMVVWTGSLNEGAGKKTVTVNVHGGKKLSYSNSDIEDLIDNMDLGADDLPKWIYVAGMHNPNFPKKKEGVLAMLKQILAAKGNVEINLASDKPSHTLDIKGIDEGVSMDAVYIHQITGCGQDAAQNFIDDNGIDGGKLADYVKQHKDSKEKYDVRDIIAGIGVGKIESLRKRFIKEMK